MDLTRLRGQFSFKIGDRKFILMNTWTYEREIYLLPCLSVSFIDGFEIDISILNVKFYTFKDYDLAKIRWSYEGEDDE